MERRYSFGGVGVTLRAPVDMSEKEALSPFTVPTPAEGFTVDCAFSEQFTLPEEPPFLAETSFTVWQPEGEEARLLRYQKEEPWPDCMWQRLGRTISMLWKPEFADRLSAWQILDALDLFHLLMEDGALVLHGSYIVHAGEGIVFSAPSGTGKSTQAALWEQFRGAEVINGDRCLLRMGPDGRVWAHGICYSGTSRICKNRSAPLKALVLLGQATENHIRVPRGLESFRFLLAQCAYRTWNPREVRIITEILSRILSAAPVFRLDCRPDESAVETLETML